MLFLDTLAKSEASAGRKLYGEFENVVPRQAGDVSVLGDSGEWRDNGGRRGTLHVHRNDKNFAHKTRKTRGE